MPTRSDPTPERNVATKLAGDLVVTRELAAPRALVFQAWIEAKRLARWFGPHGTTIEGCTLDPRPGGRLHFCHRHSDGEEVWVRGVYEEVVAPERLVFRAGFSDAAGNEVERPGFPREMRITATFAERDGRTTVTVRQAGLEVDQGERQGWIEALERLTRLLDR